MKTPRSQLVPLLAQMPLDTPRKVAKSSQAIGAFLLAEGRVGELDSLMRDIIAYRATQGTVEVTAVSAFELSATVKRDIRSRVQQLFPSARQVVINELIDPSVVGGIRLEMVDRQLDLTVGSKLNHLKALSKAT